MLFIASVLIILVTSFFCSLSEASLLSVGRARVETLASSGKGASKVLRRMKSNMERPIAAILILNTVANTGGAALAGSEYEKLFGGQHMGMFTFLLTVAVLVFSEFVPKAVGVRYSERAALFVIRPLELIVWLLTPLTWLFERGSRMLGLGGGGNKISVDDLRAMARLAASAKVLGKEELTIIDAAARLPRIGVDQIMIHRRDIVFLSLEEDVETNFVRARQSQHSRLPLSRGGIDEILGLVSMKAVLWELAEEGVELNQETFARIVGEELRPPLFVPPDLDVSQLIRLFAEHHEHLAIVREPAGPVVGIVTMEDVVEELMGEIDDEFDRSPTLLKNVGPGSWRFGGGALWADVQKSLGMPESIEVTDLDGRVDVNDLAARQLRGKLRSGAVFTLGRWTFKVTRMRRGKVLYAEARLTGETGDLPEMSSAPELTAQSS